MNTYCSDLELIFNLSKDEIFVTDGDGYCLLYNPSFIENAGLPEDTNLKGRHIDFFLKEGIFYPSATLKVIEKRQPTSLIQTTKTGKRLHVIATPFFDEDGNLTRVISNTSDITELLSLREQFQELRSLMEYYNDKLVSVEIGEDTGIEEGGLIFYSPKMKAIYESLQMVANFDTSVQLQGESGVGKTEIAKWIHSKSARKHNKFIELNCTTISPSLFESELFGYVGGAFSGAAVKGRDGILKEADQGTLFLDEIGELNLELQAKLLQFIQSKSYRPVGSNKLLHSDVRIITATNKDLQKMVVQGLFREDLYYRIAIFPIEIPPLRERQLEIPILLNSFLKRLNKKYDQNKVFSDGVIHYLSQLPWEGNIRQIKNTVERLFITSSDSLIDTVNSDIVMNNETVMEENISENVRRAMDTNESLSLKERICLLEREILLEMKQKHRTTRQVAKELDSTQSTISRKFIEYNI
ncbi:sigma-54 interaction domain-containing protein [Oceanobacillus jeddahense]|uniref:sigma-54 interaction domain-containing protein n=1 Tax=Oceanobacillus jeddahense TaxID=1462527 RepID=UPI0005959814|nr:sigma 54-interacting transcriptional regulator [Oceanobacillus jeddahense]